MELTEAQEREVIRLKQYFPYRIVYVARKGDQFEAGAMKTMSRVKRLAREGWQVAIAK